MSYLRECSELLKLFTPTHQVHTVPVGSLMKVSVHSLLDDCFSSHSLVLCSFQQFFVSSAYCFVVIDRIHDTLSLHDRRERGRDKYDYHSIDNQCHSCDLTDLSTDRERLLSVDECCQECHHCDIHDAKWKEEHKQEPAASETVGSVNEPHTKSTTISITPGTEDELQRRPAFR